MSDTTRGGPEGIARFRADAEDTALPHGCQGVQKEVQEDLLKLVRIDIPMDAFNALHDDLDALGPGLVCNEAGLPHHRSRAICSRRRFRGRAKARSWLTARFQALTLADHDHRGLPVLGIARYRSLK